MEQEYGTRTWNKNMEQEHGTRTWNKNILLGKAGKAIWFKINTKISSSYFIVNGSHCTYTEHEKMLFLCSFITL